MRIGYVLKRYPRLSETFIVQEILQMEARGADLALFPIMDPHEPLQNPAIHQVRAPVHYLQNSFLRDLPGILRDHLRLLLRCPSGYRKASRHLLHSSGSRASLRAFAQAGRLACLAMDGGIQHLHAHFAHNPASITRYASLFTDIPYSFTAHAKDLYLSRPNSLINKAELATFITTCTGFNEAYLKKILPPHLHAKIHVVYHGVDTQRFTPLPTRRDHAIPRIVSVVRLVPKKGYEFLIEAGNILHTRAIPFRLHIYGGGELRDVLQERIVSAGLDGIVRLHGACTQEELIEVYRDSDIFALAPVVTENGDRDGIPNVLLEAMSAGLPPVITAISGIPEVVTDGINGKLVPPANPEALADKLAELLVSTRLRKRIGDEARASVVTAFDARNNVRALASLLGLDEEAVCVSAMS
jgi:glycosyltransferase involved in cell wall biosynthesis